MKKIILADKFPYLLTAFFGLMGYFFNNIVNYEMEAPLLCYAMCDIAKEDNIAIKKSTKNILIQNGFEGSVDSLAVKHVRCSIQNISKSTSIKNVILTISFREKNNDQFLRPQFFFGEELLAKSPAPIDTSNTDVEPLEIKPQIDFKLSNFQPGTEYCIEFYAAYNQKIKDNPALYINCSDTVKLKEKGLLEWFVLNRLLINIILLVVFLVITFLYLKIISKSDSDEKKNNPSSVINN